MRTTACLSLAWAALLIGPLASVRAAQPYPDRWVYVARNLTRDEHVEDIRRIVATAAAHGLNGMLWAGGADTLSRWDEQRLRRLEEVKRICAAAGLEIIPLGFSVGYGGAILGYDPNLAEGLRVDRALFQVQGGEARLVPDPPVGVANGDFEQFAGQRFAHFAFQDKPGQISFVDQEIFHSGHASLRFQHFGGPDNPYGHARVMATVAVHPRRHYAFSAWVKTEGLSPTSAFALQVYGEKRHIGALRPALQPTQDWTRVVYVFNSLDNAQLRLYAGLWGGKQGRVWLDDLALEEVGLRCVLRRPGTPITVTSEDGQTLYQEGKDFAEIVDPKLRDFRGNHEDPPIKILPGSRIKEGDRLRVTFYHAQVVQDGQVCICMSEPAVYDIWRNEVRHIEERLHPQKYFLSMDEIREGGSCAACQARNMSMAQILGDCITKQCSIIRAVNPQAKIYLWSDMLDPNHNAHGDYYLVEGDFTGSWQYVPKDLVIVCWYYEKRHESLKFFSDLGFETVAGAYYDGDTLDNPKGWLEALAQTPRARGIIYTTWQNKYDLLAPFGDLLGAH
jgi:hypothetical protein